MFLDLGVQQIMQFSSEFNSCGASSDYTKVEQLSTFSIGQRWLVGLLEAWTSVSLRAWNKGSSSYTLKFGFEWLGHRVYPLKNERAP